MAHPWRAGAQRQMASALPHHVEKEFDDYLRCGVLAHGFLRLHCGSCSEEKLVGFSCKGRGFSPSCGARRMAQTAAHLVDQVLPDVPVRQWVLSLPIPLRSLLAAHPKLLGPALEIVQRVITGCLAKKSGLPRSETHTGAVTLIQRFGSAANLNIHLMCKDNGMDPSHFKRGLIRARMEVVTHHRQKSRRSPP